MNSIKKTKSFVFRMLENGNNEHLNISNNVSIYDMAQLVCSQCNYKFSSFRKPLNCPYCGKKDTVNAEATVNDILRDVDAMIADGRC